MCQNNLGPKNNPIIPTDDTVDEYWELEEDDDSLLDEEFDDLSPDIFDKYSLVEGTEFGY